MTFDLHVDHAKYESIHVSYLEISYLQARRKHTHTGFHAFGFLQYTCAHLGSFARYEHFYRALKLIFYYIGSQDMYPMFTTCVSNIGSFHLFSAFKRVKLTLTRKENTQRSESR